jgi:hypothetical protein
VNNITDENQREICTIHIKSNILDIREHQNCEGSQKGKRHDLYMNNHRKTAAPPFSPSPFRRRRITWCILITFVLVLYFGAPWEMQAYLKDVDHSTGISRANIAKLVKPASPSTGNGTHSSVDEIYGLLHLVINGGDRQLSHEVKVTSDKPVEMVYYAGVDREVNWEEEVKELNANYPIVVFSKVRWVPWHFNALIPTVIRRIARKPTCAAKR